jgi:hypothetical protein
MIILGVMVLAATLFAMTAVFLRRRARPLPVYGWMGLAALLAAEGLLFYGVALVATYFTPIVWTAYIFLADAAVFAIRGRSRLHDAPLQLARMALLSIPLWLIFEAYNLRLANWTYVGLPLSLPARWFGYAWSFATILPGIFVTADLIESCGLFDRKAQPLRFSGGARLAFQALGATLLIVPLLLPRSMASYLFGCVWLGFIFLLDPVNFRLGLPSLEGDLAEGRRARLFSLLAAGWVCGWLWEFWNFWAEAKWHYIFPILQDKKIFEMPVPGYLGFPPFALECFTMYVFAAWLLRWIKPARREDCAPPRPPAKTGFPAAAYRAKSAGKFIAILATLLAALLLPPRARASGLQLPPAAQQGLNLLYSSGQSDQAIQLFRQIEKDQPDHPLGYLLEADAVWWQIYCEACEIKWNTLDAWKRRRGSPGDGAYLALTQKVVSLAEAQIAKGDSAEMELYDGMGWALQTRLLGLYDSHRDTAHAGVEARAHLLRCLQLDPQMTDAYAGLGLYNYYADALSSLAKVLRFFMGIPGGDRKEGIRQLHMAIDHGVLTDVEARFYLAKSLRTFDQDYADAVDVMTPLTARFPQNPFFHLMLGDIQAKLARNDAAAANFRAAQQIPVANPVCSERIRSLVQRSLALLTPAPKG